MNILRSVIQNGQFLETLINLLIDSLIAAFYQIMKMLIAHVVSHIACALLIFFIVQRCIAALTFYINVDSIV